MPIPRNKALHMGAVGLSLLSTGIIASLLAIMTIYLKRLEIKILEKLRK